MSTIRFETVRDRSDDIIQTIMTAKEIVALPEMDFTIRLVVEEIITNIAYYAYPEGHDGPLMVEVERNESVLCLRFMDCGTQFNPLVKENPDITLSAEERNIGGLGIFLVRQMMDEVSYEWTDGMNILTCRKEITNQSN